MCGIQQEDYKNEDSEQTQDTRCTTAHQQKGDSNQERVLGRWKALFLTTLRYTTYLCGRSGTA